VNHLYGSIPPQHSLQSLFYKYQVPFEDCRAGDSWEWDGVQFIIWHPHLEEDLRRQFALTKPNEMSCVVEIRNQHHSVWLTGDVERRGESLMTQRIKTDILQHHAILDRQLILMAPHHGSKTSSTQALIDTLDPQYVFSQTGFKNRYQHPHTEVVNRYRQKNIPFFDTVSSGAQVWRSEGSILHLRTWR
jgi:competence protein ComEC